MFRHSLLALGLALALTSTAVAQQPDKPDKSLDIRSSIGDLHVGKDANAEKAGLPLYPGARPKHEDDNEPLNLGILTENFGLTLIVAEYESDDPPAKIIAFYQDKMKKYGKVLACDNKNDNGGIHTGDGEDISKPLKCEGNNTGPIRELKVGTEGNARLITIDPKDNGKGGTTFSIVYLHRRGKSGEL